MSTLASRIRVARLAADLSQTELAKRARVRSQTINQLESGKSTKCSAETLLGLSRVLGIDPFTLFYGASDLRGKPGASDENGRPRLAAMLSYKIDKLPEGVRDSLTALVDAIHDQHGDNDQQSL